MNFLFTITKEFSDEIAGIYSSLMPKERRLRFVQCKDVLHKKQMVAAYMLLCYSLNKTYGENYVRIAFDYGSTGKPYLQNEKDKFFSISHSDKYVLCSISSHAIGSDIQKIFSEQERIIDFSISESLIKLKDDYTAVEKVNAKISTKCKCGDDYIISVSGFGVVETDIINVSFNELIEYFNKRTTIGEYYNLNSYVPSFSVDYTPLEMFKRNVNLYGNRTAVSFKGRNITYKELNTYSDVIAERLLKAGAKIGDSILLSICPSIEFSIAQFAIMKAGCTYIPVYKRWPLERINYIIKDCNITIGIFDQAKLFFDCNVEVKVICNDYFCKTVYSIDVNERKNDICYIIYTSGSTGFPKGVMVTKTNLASFSVNKAGTYYHELVKSNYVRVACICPISFDMSVAENTTSLLNGCTVIFADEDEQYPENFAAFIINNNIEILWATPSKFKMYLQSKDCVEALKNLKVVVLAGEVLDFETARLSSKFSFQLYNTYGPTETTIISTYYHVQKIEFNLPIGRPFANEACYVINQSGNLCEVGEKGELYIAGECVAAGYKNNRKQTEERFLKNIFGHGIMYRTGDVVALENDGYLHFFGRKDNQVKVHGFRVELEEIESAIYSYTKHGTVVCLCESQLVAFIESSVGRLNLCNDLKRVLPDYMIPCMFYYVEKFPLNDNGKIDKKALIAILNNSVPSEYVAPTNELECLIVDCWCQYLSGVRIGIDDDFFQLGGDSIIAMRIASVLRKKGFDVSMFDIINYKTINNLVKVIERHRKENISIIPPFVNSVLYADEDAEISLNPYLEYQTNFIFNSECQEYLPLKMHKTIMEEDCSCDKIIYKVDGTDNRNLIIKAIKNLIKNNAAFRSVYDRDKGKCRQCNFSDSWVIPFLKAENLNRHFLYANSKVNLKGSIQYLSYIFLVEDCNNELYVILMLHWRFLDKSAVGIINKQLSSLLNDEKLSTFGIVDPLEYTKFVQESSFNRNVIPDDIATALTDFAELSSDKELNRMLNNLNCFTFNCSIALNANLIQSYNNSPLNFIINVFASVLHNLLKRDKIPIYIVDQNRNMANSNLVDTVIDFLPLVITNDKYDYYRYIKKIIALRQPGESLIESGDWNASEEPLPFINYISVLDEADTADIEMVDKVAYEISVEEKHDKRISCSAFVKDGKLVLSCSLPKLSKAILQSSIEQLLVGSSV